MRALVKISDFADVYAGGGAPQNANDFSEDGIPFLRAGSLPKLLNGAKESDLEKITNEVAKMHRLQLHKKGSVVFAKSGMSATKGHIYRLKNDCYVVNHLAVVKPNAICDGKYLEHALKQYSPTSLILDAAYPSIRLSDISDFKIPLPPLAQQQRIAEILDKAAEIKVKREQAIAKLDELARSTFVEMFGDVKNNVHSFAKKQLGDLIKLSSGNFLPASNMQENGQYAVYGGNGINGYHDAYMFKERRIVIGRVGAYCGCVHITNEKAWITDNALYVDVKDKDLDFDYLAYALMMANLNSVSSKSGQPLVSGSRIYPVEILKPPLSLQQNFARAKAKIDALKRGELRGMDDVIKLTASLQHQAFTIGFNA